MKMDTRTSTIVWQTPFFLMDENLRNANGGNTRCEFPSIKSWGGTRFLIILLVNREHRTLGNTAHPRTRKAIYLLKMGIIYR